MIPSGQILLSYDDYSVFHLFVNFNDQNAHSAIYSSSKEMRVRCCSFASPLLAKNPLTRCPQVHHFPVSAFNDISWYHKIHSSKKVSSETLILTKKMVDALETYKKINGTIKINPRLVS